jgi:hypothetical protein
VNTNTVAALISKTRSGADAYGQDVFTESYTVMPALFSPGGSTETVFGQDQVVTSPTLYLPTGTPVQAIDAAIPQVLVDSAGAPVLDGSGHPQGVRYDVDGLPSAWPANPFTGWQPALSVVVRLKGATG